VIVNEPLPQTPPERQGCGCGHHDAAANAQTAALAAGAVVTVRPMARPVAQAPASTNLAPHKCACKKLRPYRRIHSLAGLLFGAFLAVHLGIAATAVSPSTFEANANALHAFTERFPAFELIALSIPLLVLLALGIHLLVEAGLSPTRKRCRRGGRVRYFLQRSSAVVILAFIAFHVLTLSHWGLHGGSYAPSHAFVSVAAALRASPAIEALYFLAIVAVSYHFANGLWTGAIAWGAIESERAKRAWEAVCAVFGAALCTTGLVALYAFVHAAGSA
jgi:succinate dehydrogenase / fumarate reductase cytochrome b subunit